MFPPSALCRPRTNCQLSSGNPPCRVYPGGATTGPLRPAFHLFGFRRVYPGGATTGPLRPAIHLSASVGFIPAEPRTWSATSGNPPFRLPSGLSRRSHNWSATSGNPPFGFRRVYPGGATTGQLPSHPAHRRSSPQRAITTALIRDRIKPRHVSVSAVPPLCLHILDSAGTLCVSSAVAGQSA